MMLAPFYVANVAVPFLVSGAEKDELAMSRHIMWQKPLGKIVSKCFTSQSWALIMAETRHDIRRMTLGAHNYHRQPGGMQDPLGYTTHHQAFQTTPTMC